ncbi:MAG: hypothetical protein Q8P81_04390, partial [Nanoarchaeota archaeon]|nr:hypothetical protein [Nanoarchaeota archaeon]
KNMNILNYLKKEHEDIFKSIIEVEEVIEDGNTSASEIIYIFTNFLRLVKQHEQNESFIFRKLENNCDLKVPMYKIMIDSRRINGHVFVMKKAMHSQDETNLRVALDNDGRMLLSKIKEQIFREEMVLDRILFLHMNSEIDA